MDRQEYIKAIRDVICLAYCAVNGKTPPQSRVRQMDTEAVREAAQHHMLAALCAMELEKAGVTTFELTQIKGKAIRKNAQLDIDRAAILSGFEQQGIWYMPLKGVIIKDLYPEYGMRQMSDNDILFDENRREDVRKIMLSLGFTAESFGSGTHDVYFKQPVSNFEMHICLFSIAGGSGSEKFDYYNDVKSRLVKDSANRFGYHFTNEDNYIYVVAHEHKHYAHGGTGLRSLLDIYVLLNHFKDKLDMQYITNECEKLGIADFERQNRALALHLFSGSKLTAEDKKLLRYIVFSGTYGTFDNVVSNRLSKNNGSKLRYVIDRLIIPMQSVKEFYPLFYKYKFLLPLLPFYRAARGLTIHRTRLKAELKALIKQRK